LSVAGVVERPWLRSRTDALGQQWALPFHGFSQPTKVRTIVLRPAPELALLPEPEVGTLDARIGSGNIFFDDAAAAHGPLVPAAWRKLGRIVPLAVPNEETRADRAWVDARLAFAQRPDLAQPLGGALTTSASALLLLTGGSSALVFVDGTLRSADGRVLTRSTAGYRWIAVPESVRGVRCIGLCLVAALGHPPPAPLEPAPQPVRGLQFQALAPWLVIADVPAGRPGALRYNTAYDVRWAAYLGGSGLTHLRLDGAVNGWLLPARPQARQLILIEVTSASELVAELAVLFALAAFAAYSLKDLQTTSSESARVLPAARQELQ
jgi:hypothetical protein